MRYKVTNNSSSLKALASAAAGEKHFVKPETSEELDLRPLSHDLIKKYAEAGLVVEALGDVEETLSKAQKKAAAAKAATAPDAPLTPPITAAPELPVVPEPQAPVAPPAVVPEPWQKGLEPPK